MRFTRQRRYFNHLGIELKKDQMSHVPLKHLLTHIAEEFPFAHFLSGKEVIAKMGEMALGEKKKNQINVTTTTI